MNSFEDEIHHPQSQGIRGNDFKSQEAHQRDNLFSPTLIH